jgi:hypothetical protein
MYMSILILSVGLWMQRNPMLVAPLLAMQVCYKLTTPITVGSLANPVVISNIVIAIVHVVTLRCILSHHRVSAK